MLAFIERLLRPERLDQPGFAVRLNWRNGEHHLAGFSATREQAIRERRRSIRIWCRGPERPVSCAVVATTYAEVLAHSHLVHCRRVECPAVDVGQPGVF